MHKKGLVLRRLKKEHLAFFFSGIKILASGFLHVISKAFKITNDNVA